MTAALGLLAAVPVLADPQEGTGKTKPDDNGTWDHVQIVPFCGTLVRAFDIAGASVTARNIGRRIVRHMQAQGSGVYGNGKIWSPDRDKTHAARMVLTGNQMVVSGCVPGICRDGVTRTRLN